jgi:hypothetical protein
MIATAKTSSHVFFIATPPGYALAQREFVLSADFDCPFLWRLYAYRYPVSICAALPLAMISPRPSSFQFPAFFMV